LTPPAGRPLGGLERVWWAASRIHPPFAIQIVMQTGTLPAQRWADALTTAAQAHPGMRGRLRGWLKRTRWTFDGPGPHLRREPGPWDGQGTAPFLERPLALRAGRGLELVLVGDFAILRAHHALVDGRGLWAMAEDTLRALDGRPLAPADGGPCDLEVVADLAAPAFVPPPADQPSPWGAPVRGASSGLIWARCRLPAGPAVTPRLLAALAATLGPVRVGVPVDLRRHRPALRSDAHLTGVIHLDLPAGCNAEAAGAALAAALARNEAVAHARAADALRGVPLSLMAAAGRAAIRKSMKTGRFPVAVTLSNLGRCPLTLHGQPVPAFWVPPGNPGMPLFLAVVGDAEGLEVCALAPAALADGGRLTGLLDRLAGVF